MTMARWWSRVYRVLASVHLAVITMAAIGAACVAATFHEASRGTAATRRLFYDAPWFTGLLVILAVNILCSTIKRYPWTRHNVGFVIAHAGILILLGGSLVSLHSGLDGRMAVVEGESSDQLALPGESLHVGLPDGTHAVIPVAFATSPPAPGTRLALPGSTAAVVVEEYQPNVRLGDVWAEAVPGQDGPPALQFTLGGHVQPQTGWLMANGREDHLEYGPVLFSLHGAADAKQRQTMLRTARDRNVLAFVIGPDGRLDYAISTIKGTPRTGAAGAGDTIATPWMGLTVHVDRVLARAARHRVATRLPLPKKDEDRAPAVRLRLEGTDSAAARWLAFSDTEHIALPAGMAHVGYGPVETTLPFRVALLDFKSETYPGSRMAATYESQVRVDDPERGTSFHHISMNHPLHYRGYTFFQASFVAGEPATSVFSVSRAPGLPLVYLGTTLIGVGVLWLSFVKRWVARRQARQALAARRGPVPAMAHARG
jgi:hypothetical protein